MSTAHSIIALNTKPTARVILAAFHRNLHVGALERCPREHFAKLDGESLKSQQTDAVKAVLQLFDDNKKVIEKLLSEGRPVELDFGIEFNFGFTGGDYTSLPFIIAHIQQDSLYAIVRNDRETSDAIANKKVPVKFLLAGAGGTTNYPSDFTINNAGRIVPITNDDLVKVSLENAEKKDLEDDLTKDVVNLRIEVIDSDKNIPLVVKASAQTVYNLYGYNPKGLEPGQANRFDALTYAGSMRRPSSASRSSITSPSSKSGLTSPQSKISSTSSPSSGYGSSDLISPSPISGLTSPSELSSPQSGSTPAKFKYPSPDRGEESPSSTEEVPSKTFPSSKK